MIIPSSITLVLGYRSVHSVVHQYLVKKDLYTFSKIYYQRMGAFVVCNEHSHFHRVIDPAIVVTIPTCFLISVMCNRSSLSGEVYPTELPNVGISESCKLHVHASLVWK